MNDSLVLVERRNTTAVITLNRPESLNALSRELLHELTKTFRELQKDSAITAAIITGAGRAFCAGLDLNQLSEEGLDGIDVTGENDIEAAILEFDRPIIGAINGVAATGGFELALWCDILIASTQAKFIDTHARIGVVPGWGLTQRLQRIIGVNRARELHFTGNPLSAHQAEQWGMVNRVVKPEELLPTCEALAADIAGCDPPTLKLIKQVVNEGGNMTLDAAQAFEQQVSDRHSKQQGGDDISQRRHSMEEHSRSKT